MTRRPTTSARSPRAAVAVACLSVLALIGCKGKTTPTDSSTAPSGPAASADPAAPPAAAGVGTTLFEVPFYTVVAGDTIGKIATKLGVPVQRLIDANGIDKPDKIVVGQKLRVPVGGAAAEVTTTTAGG